ncbi:dihydropteroate synthase [Corynebacterium timonense]|nr:dihydropteroate synthase [Corynebacterium timonense]
MGILNVTEDSFSDGGRWLRTDDALAHARELVRAGADIIDVGGESTRPGATRVPAEVEAARVRPVIEALHAEGIRTSVDTMRAATAAAAVEAGVDLINDVSGGLADPDMYRVMAQAGVPVCLMHWRADSYGDAAGAADHGGDVVSDVHAVLRELADNAIAAGVDPERITVDPGLGFAKTAADNWALLAALETFVAGPFPVLVGASRKRFLTSIRKQRGLEHTPVDADPATAAVSALSARAGAWCVRVHEVAVTRDAVDVVAAWREGGA